MRSAIGKRKKITRRVTRAIIQNDFLNFINCTLDLRSWIFNTARTTQRAKQQQPAVTDGSRNKNNGFKDGLILHFATFYFAARLQLHPIDKDLPASITKGIRRTNTWFWHSFFVIVNKVVAHVFSFWNKK